MEQNRNHYYCDGDSGGNERKSSYLEERKQLQDFFFFGLPQLYKVAYSVL